MSENQNRRPSSGPGPMGGGMAVQKAKNFKSSGKRLVESLKPQKHKIVMVFITSIISVLFSILSPKILGKATDSLVEGIKSGTIDFNYIKTIIMYLLVMYCLSSIFAYI